MANDIVVEFKNPLVKFKDLPNASVFADADGTQQLYMKVYSSSENPKAVMLDEGYIFNFPADRLVIRVEEFTWKEKS